MPLVIFSINVLLALSVHIILNKIIKFELVMVMTVATVIFWQ